MDAHSHVELVLSHVLHHVLVGADTGSFQSLASNLFDFIGHQVDAQREVLHTGLLTTKVENPDLGVCARKHIYKTGETVSDFSGNSWKIVKRFIAT